jgi:hypothetical protein
MEKLKCLKAFCLPQIGRTSKIYSNSGNVQITHKNCLTLTFQYFILVAKEKG